MVIKFLFCKISWPRTSGCVLIDISNLTHFLSCNLFVMSCLTSSAISDFRECFGISLTITVNYPVRMVNAITNTLLPSSTAIFENVLKTRMGHPAVLFLRGLLPIFPNFMSYRMEVGGYFSEFCECSQNSRSCLMYTAPLVS